MGYRNQVRINTNTEGYNALLDEYTKLYNEATNNGTDTSTYIFPTPQDIQAAEINIVNGDGVVFGWDWVKWSDIAFGDAFEGAVVIMDVISQLGDEGLPYQFVRIGEEYGDIDDLYYGQAYEKLPYLLSVGNDIDVVENH